MSELLLSLGVFIAFHIIPAIGPVRRVLVKVIGLVPYIVGYSMISIAILVWVGVAYTNADTDILWPQWPWTRWVPVVVMPLSCLFFVSTLREPNTLSVGVKADQYDAARPGIVSVTRHPLIWSLLLWAVAHVLPNGDSTSIVLFGLFAVLGAVGPWSLDKKKCRDLGEEHWQRFTAPTSSLPFWAILTGRAKLDWRGIGMINVALAMVLYVVLLLGHEHVIGASPFPF